MKNQHIGSTFESFLKEEGIYDEVSRLAEQMAVTEKVRKIRHEERLAKKTNLRPGKKRAG